MNHPRRLVSISLSLLVAGGCGTPDPDDEGIGRTTQALAGQPLTTLVTGVGATSEGHLAVRFLGAWFALRVGPTSSWEIENAVAATEIGVVPTDTSEQELECDCVPPPDHGFCHRSDWIEQCGTAYPPTITHETRRYMLTVGPSQYELIAYQTIRRERAYAPTHLLRIGFQSDLRFEVRVVTPGAPGIGDARWVVGARPKRPFIDCTFDDATLEAINLEAELADPGSPQDCEATYSAEVQLDHARTESLPGATSMRAPTNDATNESLAQLLRAGEPYLVDVEPEAYDVRGDVLARVQDGTFGHISDLDRTSRFFLRAREISAYSDPATERPLVTAGFPRVPEGLGIFPTNSMSWSFDHTIIDQRARWPLLWGICGIEAFVKSSVSGAVNYGHMSCFDGIVQSVEYNGRLAFDAAAGAGGYCNIIVASASAGMSAGVTSAIEFSSVLETVPPALVSTASAYADLRFAAYFQTRILFWSKRWEKPFFTRRVWQRNHSWRLFEQVSAPQLCDPQTPDIRDMALSPTVFYTVQGTSAPFPPPVPNGTTTHVQVVLPPYPTAASNLVVQSTGSGTFPPATITQLSGPTYLVTFPSEAMGLVGTLHRIRLARSEVVPGVGTIRHVSNWVDVARVGP